MARNSDYREQLAQKRRYWEKHVETWRASGMPQAQYCRQHNLKVHCLVYWRKKFVRQDHPPVPFVQIKLPEKFQLPRPAAIKIAVGSCRIEVERGFDPDTLKKIVHTLGQL